MNSFIKMEVSFLRAYRWMAVIVATIGLLVGSMASASTASQASGWGGSGKGGLKNLTCASDHLLCTEVANQQFTFGNKYVGHDEPSLLFYSHQHGSGSRMQYTFKLPVDPSPDTSVVGRSYTFELTPAIWFGMALCNDQSAPNPGIPCKPDSNSNITSNPAKAPGSAYVEMQFYPPGYTPWPLGISCSASRWCAAINIWSLAEDDLHGTQLNQACQAATGPFGGLEYGNFAFITLNGKPQAPPNPIDSTAASYTPNVKKDLFMGSGDTVRLRMFDTKHGLRIAIKDNTTGKSGSMTASAANGFAQIKYEPTGVQCTPIPYDFHPEYSTSGPKTVVPWAAHTYNVAMDEETGHFDWCTQGPDSPGPVSIGGTCDPYSSEGMPGTTWKWSDGDDYGCFPASFSLLVKVQGCIGSNDPGFDGAAYLPDWPDGNTNLHPTPFLFTSPLTGSGYGNQYQRVAFQADTPAIEIAPECYHATGLNCMRVPLTDNGQPVAFYPFFWTSKHTSAGCWWGLGNDVPGMTKNDFGKAAQYKYLQSYVGLNPANPGTTRRYSENYGQTLPNNPCPAKR